VAFDHFFEDSETAYFLYIFLALFIVFNFRVRIISAHILVTILDLLFELIVAIDSNSTVASTISVTIFVEMMEEVVDFIFSLVQ